MEEKDYKKLYEDVVTLAKDGLKDGLYLSRSAKDVTEFLFPQLKETEDEKVKRELTRFLINFNNGYYSKPSETEIDSWIKWIDKKCEQKPTDKVEPKFKVGDWVVHDMSDGRKVIRQIVNMTNKSYVLDGEDFNTFYFNDIENDYHLWTIEDAKDGDVLANGDVNIVLIFKCFAEPSYRQHIIAHIGLDASGDIQVTDEYWNLGFDCGKPATKEQRDLLFQKMKEAGYEWDAEKKELKSRIIACGEEDENSCKKSEDVTEEKDMTEYKKGFECGKQLVLKYPEDFNLQPKQEWSEEDSERLLRIHQFIWANRKGDTDEIYQQEQDADWLMSIIPQSN